MQYNCRKYQEVLHSMESLTTKEMNNYGILWVNSIFKIPQGYGMYRYRVPYNKFRKLLKSVKYRNWDFEDAFIK